MTGIIYVTQCLVTGKIYVGIHTLGQEHYLGSGKYLNRAIKKYGRENFRRIDVDEFNSIEEGCCKERIWIRELNSKVPNGYNLNDGGEGQFNPCQEVREKIGSAHRDKPGTMTGHHHSSMSKRKMSTAKVGKSYPKLSAVKKGKPWSPARRIVGNPKRKDKGGLT